MQNEDRTETSSILASVATKLSLADNLLDATQIITETARILSSADGATFVLRENNQCYYVDDNAISPLWKGKRFPIEDCISGWSMIHRKIVCISNIYLDPRIPQDAYRPTFVKSLCMIPIRSEKPMGAIGCYWADEYTPNTTEIKLLQVLADIACVALENLELKKTVSQHFLEASGLKERSHQLELAMYSMAHDLRSPVSVMTGLGEILKSKLKEINDTSLLETVQGIVETGRHTASLLDRMLLLYKATNGKIDKQEVDLTGFARRILHGFQALFSERVIHCHIEPNMTAYADPSLIYVVLENLLSNAVKYSSKAPQSEIHVGCVQDQKTKSTFYVRDNGIGFSPSEATLLFRPLGRLDNKWEFGGAGLGLASVAHIIALHGGEVRAEAKQHHGATFFFSLPHKKRTSHEQQQ